MNNSKLLKIEKYHSQLIYQVLNVILFVIQLCYTYTHELLNKKFFTLSRT